MERMWNLSKCLKIQFLLLYQFWQIFIKDLFSLQGLVQGIIYLQSVPWQDRA